MSLGIVGVLLLGFVAIVFCLWLMQKNKQP